MWWPGEEQLLLIWLLFIVETGNQGVLEPAEAYIQGVVFVHSDPSGGVVFVHSSPV